MARLAAGFLGKRHRLLDDPLVSSCIHTLRIAFLSRLVRIPAVILRGEALTMLGISWILFIRKGLGDSCLVQYPCSAGPHETQSSAAVTTVVTRLIAAPVFQTGIGIRPKNSGAWATVHAMTEWAALDWQARCPRPGSGDIHTSKESHVT